MNPSPSLNQTIAAAGGFFLAVNHCDHRRQRTGGRVGFSLVENLFEYEGRVFPVNPKRATVLRQPAFQTVGDVPERIDLAVNATPAAATPGVVRECDAAGVKAAIVHSAGSRSAERRVRRWKEKSSRRACRGSRLSWPNGPGLMAPHAKLNAKFAPTLARPETWPSSATAGRSAPPAPIDGDRNM